MTKQSFFAKHGRVVIGLLAHVIEEHHGSDEFVPAPLTVDMFRLPNIQTPVEITTGLVRDGRRIKVVEAEFFSGGTSIARLAIGECWLYDEKGPIGTSTVAALAQKKPMTNVPPP
ncbi:MULTISPECIES: thioesterase family protein [unclassified Bradyrhizobium]|uniref:thioesterase family protein n=1 Tax=unclassified Bradyrhizobium TaxID=2631580 RepID=UPI001FED61DC|nr:MULTISPECIES: thioesterase family protein [unclassified Bradyrhizobium]